MTFLVRTLAVGIWWDIPSDSFYYAVKIPTASVLTRKVMLSCLSGIYDPLGLIAPMVMTGKMIFQQSTRDNGSHGQIRS